MSDMNEKAAGLMQIMLDQMIIVAVGQFLLTDLLYFGHQQDSLVQRQPVTATSSTESVRAS